MVLSARVRSKHVRLSLVSRTMHVPFTSLHKQVTKRAISLLSQRILIIRPRGYEIPFLPISKHSNWLKPMRANQLE